MPKAHENKQTFSEFSVPEPEKFALLRMHHTQFAKFREIFELVHARDLLPKFTNRISDLEIRQQRAKLQQQINAVLAHFRRRGEVTPAAIMSEVERVIETYGLERGLNYIEKIRKRRRAS